DARGEPVEYVDVIANNPRSLAVDHAGNIYWYVTFLQFGPRGYVRSVHVWEKATGQTNNYLVEGLNSLIQLQDGGVAGIIGGPNEYDRCPFRLEAFRVGGPVAPFVNLPLHSAGSVGSVGYSTVGVSLFRGQPGSLEMLAEPPLSGMQNFAPDFVVSASNAL